MGRILDLEVQWGSRFLSPTAQDLRESLKLAEIATKMLDEIADSIGIQE
ncbi:hypothetical protein GW755_00620 [bacterium]|nr:hypothetical protein [bacterium]